MARGERKEKPTWADLQREVRAAGGVLERQGATSHEVWKLPDGKQVTLQSKRPKEQVTRSIRDRIRDAIDGKV